jgi:ribokinase
MTHNIKIISVGAAVQDVILRGRIFEPHRDKAGDKVNEFELGSKNEVEAITHSTGGGATNAAVTFARQGLRSFYMGKIGDDIAGKVVLETLRQDDVDTSLVSYNKELGTGYSAILLSPNGERTVLTYRGASSHYHLKESEFFNQTADWMYVSSLSGDVDALKTILAYADEHKIKVAINPGKGEFGQKKLFKELLASVEILSLNKEEMAELFKGETAEELAIAAAKHVAVALVTDGPNGSFVCDGEKVYKAGMYEDVPVIDRLGAGDAFTSGFVAAIARGQTVGEALILGSANSTGVVGKIGSKAGILHHNARLHDMPITSKPL